VNAGVDQEEGGSRGAKELKKRSKAKEMFRDGKGGGMLRAQKVPLITNARPVGRGHGGGGGFENVGQVGVE